MDSVMTFLSNYYIWFLIAAGVFFFALIGLIIESAKKRKKNKNGDVTEAAAPVEAFRNEDVPAVSAPVEEVAETPVVPEAPTMSETPVVAPVIEEAPVVAPVVEMPEPVSPVPTVEPIPTVEPAPVQMPEPAPVMDATPVFGSVEAAPTDINNGNNIA